MLTILVTCHTLPIIAKTRYADTTWATNEIKLLLANLTLGADTSLSCLAVEVLPGGVPTPDPLGARLGQERILRTSPLVPVPAICGA